MRLTAYDNETFLIRPGRLIPRLVCSTFCGPDGIPSIEHANGNATTAWLAVLKDRNALLIGHNIVFDLATSVDACADKEDALRAVFNALDDGRIRDTMIRQKLFHIRKGDLQTMRKGSLSLAGLAKLYLGEEMQKGEDTWRLRYQELIDVPLRDWPHDATHYALHDAKQTMRVFMAQDDLFTRMKYTGAEPHSCRDEVFQMKAAWALHLIAAWGIKTNPEKVAKLVKACEEKVDTYTTLLQQEAIVRPDGSQDMGLLKARIVAAFTKKGLKPPVTAKGAVSTKKETLEEVAEEDPLLRAVHERKHLEKMLNTFIAPQRPGKIGLIHGSPYPITPRYNSIVATTRISCANPNLTNQPKEDGIRECFEPRDGFLFCDADYSTLEMRCFAQIMKRLGLPTILLEAFRKNMDTHSMLGATITGRTYDEFYPKRKGEYADIRAISKNINYGMQGGLGAPKLKLYLKQFGIDITAEQSVTYRNGWFDTWQARGYFQWVNSLMNPLTELANVPLASGAIRGGCRYTVCANTPFQSLAAYGAKEALWQLAKETYLDRSSDLYGSRVVAFVHDQNLVEVPEEHAHPAAMRVKKIMEECMMIWTPDVPQEAEPALSRCWSKSAAPVFDEEMHLIPWADEEETA